MKSKSIFVVVMGSAGALALLAANGNAAEVSATEVAAAQDSAVSAPTSLQISSEVTPDFLAPTASTSAAFSLWPRAQWIENPLLKAQSNLSAWRDGSDVQLLDAAPEPSFEIEILPPQSPTSPGARPPHWSLSPARLSSAAPKISLQTQQAAKIAVERAELLERAGVPLMAVAQLRRAVSMAPRDIIARRALAQWSTQHAQWPQAAAQWREVLYELQVQSAASDENSPRESQRAEATRELRGAQQQLFAFWNVPDVVTLGADSQNPIARNATTRNPNARDANVRNANVPTPTAIAMASTSRALASSTRATFLSRVETTPATTPVSAPLIIATPQPRSESVKRLVENVVETLPTVGHRFDIIITSSSYLHPQNSAKIQFTGARSAKANATGRQEKIVIADALDSSREDARLLSMQRQLQPWLGKIIRVEVKDQPSTKSAISASIESE